MRHHSPLRKSNQQPQEQQDHSLMYMLMLLLLLIYGPIIGLHVVFFAGEVPNKEQTVQRRNARKNGASWTRALLMY
jgi:flagellar basal body-associated protein FliL